MALRSAAILTLKDVKGMTKRGRKSIAAWLRQQARYMDRDKCPNFAKRYTARYMYT